MPTWSARLRHAPFVLFVGGVLAYGAAFAWYLLDRFDLVNLIRDVNWDDSFYYFQIAWRMAGGEFSTFDGITRTNGYHPLWLFLITPFYWVFDKEEALFAIKAFEIMLVAGGVALVAGAARVARLPWVLLFAALPALYRNPALFLGLEAAAALFLLGLFLLAVCLFARDPAGWRWPLAAVAFALPWVRLEYVAISLAATAALCLVEWSGSAPRAHRGGWSGWGRSVSALHAAGPLAGAVVGVLAYCTYNAVVFGGVLPVSAAAKQWLSQREWDRYGGYSLTGNIDAYLQSGFFDDEFLVALEVCVYVVLVWWFSRRSRGREDRLLLAFLVGVFGLAAGHVAKFAQSVLTTHPFFLRYDWYFVPAYLMGALVVPARCCVAIWFVRRFLGAAPRRASRISTLGIVTAGAVFLLATADFIMPFRYVDSAREDIHVSQLLRRSMGAAVMDRLLPKGAVVGAEASGAMGYFSRFPVVNLDGLVNSWDYLRAMREGPDVAYRPRRGITHFAGTRPLAAARRTALFEGPQRRIGEAYQFRVWPASGAGRDVTGANRSEWFWKRMAPHLEHQAAGVGLLVDGRLAHAFSRDCAGENAGETMAIWTWAGQDEPVRKAWTPTAVGFCVSDVVLPHDTPPLSVRVETMPGEQYLADRVAGRPRAIDADSDVYVVDDTLVYVKEACGPEDVGARFFLHVDPVDPDDLPVPRRRHGFDNLDFGFRDHGVLFRPCMMEVPLPDYGIAAIRTGRFLTAEDGFSHLWEGEIRLGPDGVPLGEPDWAGIAERVRGRQPVVDADFDVYVVDDTLVYVKEACGPEDVDARFFLHVDPVDPDDLPVPRRRHGFDNLDFRFDARGGVFGGTCLAAVTLPEYGVAAVRTGRFVKAEGGFRTLWESEIR